MHKYYTCRMESVFNFILSNFFQARHYKIFVLKMLNVLEDVNDKRYQDGYQGSNGNKLVQVYIYW